MGSGSGESDDVRCLEDELSETGRHNSCAFRDGQAGIVQGPRLCLHQGRKLLLGEALDEFDNISLVEGAVAAVVTEVFEAL